MTISCANKSDAGILGLFFACMQAPQCKTGKLIEIKTMVYVIEGDTLLLSTKALRNFGCIPNKFPNAGLYLSKGQVDIAVANLISKMYEEYYYYSLFHTQLQRKWCSYSIDLRRWRIILHQSTVIYS